MLGKIDFAFTSTLLKLMIDFHESFQVFERQNLPAPSTQKYKVSQQVLGGELSVKISNHTNLEF